MRFKKMKNLFLRQSYLDSWEDYERSLRKRNFIKWDYIILTASNEAQADAYREQIEERIERDLSRLRQSMQSSLTRKGKGWDPAERLFRSCAISGSRRLRRRILSKGGGSW